MIRFYAPDIENESILPEVESGHCCRVLRMRAGDEIEVVDGKGMLFKCKIKDPNPKSTILEILSNQTVELHWKPTITLAVAPTKNIDRMEWLVEKCVEIGVNRIVFINCRNSVRRVAKRERLVKIMISAMKQSLKAELPDLVEMIDFNKFIDSDKSGSALKYVGYCDDNTPRVEFANEYDGSSDLIIMIGPEGDFTKQEIEHAIDAGFKPVTFGNTRLRTETAALFSLCSAHTLISQKINDV